MSDKITKIIAGTMVAVIIAVPILIFAWFANSFIDIVADNRQPNPQHHKYNAFVIGRD